MVRTRRRGSAHPAAGLALHFRATPYDASTTYIRHTCATVVRTTTAGGVAVATVVAWTGTESRALRDAYRLSQSKFAAKLGTTTRTVQRWEAGKPIGWANQADLDTMLANAPEGVVAVFERLLDDQEGDVKRRAFITTATTAAVGVTAAFDPGRADALATGSGKPDEWALAHVRSTLYAAMTLDDSMGSPAAQGITEAQLALTESMLRECPDALRPELLSLRGEWIAFAGCLAWDCGDHSRAAAMYHEAREIAHDAEDSDLGAYIHCHLSQLAIWQQRPRIAMDHAAAARSWVAQSDDRHLRAYVDLRLAEAAAISGQQQASTTALESASHAAAELEPATPAQSRAYFTSPAMLDAFWGGCLTMLGDARPAAEASRRAVALMDPTRPRDRALSMLELQRSLLQLGEVEEGAAMVGDAAELTDRNRSPRLARAILDARRALSPWAGSEPVRALDARLNARDIMRS
ncbi:helix-turn-helix domain-containing protein [Nocardia nova]|uniref:helix-turn-helix domain-containing protein n=1 Tax=Nocardia nova TaxID=37330 RepID=UPI0011DD1441|nr:helix-turn-helix domain-containing protein [Nocardia nova]